MGLQCCTLFSTWETEQTGRLATWWQLRLGVLTGTEWQCCWGTLWHLGPLARLFQPDVELLDLVMVLLLPPPRLLLRDLQMLLVLADCRQLVLNLHDPLLCNLNSLLSALQLVLHHGQRPGKVVRLHLIVRCNPLGLSVVEH